MLRTDLHLNTALMRTTSGRILRTFKQVCFVCLAVTDRKLLVLWHNLASPKLKLQQNSGFCCKNDYMDLVQSQFISELHLLLCCGKFGLWNQWNPHEMSQRQVDGESAGLLLYVTSYAVCQKTALKTWLWSQQCDVASCNTLSAGPRVRSPSREVTLCCSFQL